MKQSSFEHPRKKVSQRDKFIVHRETNKEIEGSLRNPETKRVRYEKIQEDLNFLMQEYFPEEFKNFRSPSISVIMDSFGTSVNYFREGGEWLIGKEEVEHAADSNVDALIAAAIIRYVDNFIDEALWPRIHEYKKEVLGPHFKSFLERALGIARFWDRDMPDEIIKLPLVEMDLEIDPSQSNFDVKFTDFIEHKSFDMAYVDKLFRKVPSHAPQGSYLFYIGKSLVDLSRDFYAVDQKDFNVYGHIVRHHLDPSAFIEYVEKFLDDFGQPYNDDHEGNEVVRVCREMLNTLYDVKLRQDNSPMTGNM